VGERRRAPGLDEIAVAAPPGRCLCNSREHARLGCLAEVVVTFGELGTRWHPDALWQDCWGRSYPLCAECWDTVRQIAANRRPGLVITQAASAATSAPSPSHAPAAGPPPPSASAPPPSPALATSPPGRR
jgi:hypothetical protein